MPRADRPTRRRRPGALVLGAVLPLLGTLAAAQERAEEGEYAGQEMCLGCHQGVLEAYGHTVHFRALTPQNATRPLLARGCEACHGPGAAHASSAGRTDATPGWLTFGERDPESRKRQVDACLQCHAGDTQRFWHGSAHESGGLSCTSCHSVKSNKSPRHQLSEPTEAAVCRTCHALPAAQSMRSAHMPTREGLSGLGGEQFMSCASCHNPHGTIADHLIDAHTVNDSCYSCHADKRGPFLWEHAPVTESCLNCHVPHGGLKPSMLRISAPRLCQTCHVQTLHVSEARRPESRFVRGLSCMQCHPQVHGSNHPSGAFFTR